MKLSVLFILISLWSFNIFAMEDCDSVRHGGDIDFSFKKEASVVFKAGELQEALIFTKEEKQQNFDLRPAYDDATYRDYGEVILAVSITGNSAYRIYSRLLDYYANQEPSSCHMQEDFRNKPLNRNFLTVVYGQGVACSSRGEGTSRYTECALYILKDKHSTISGLLRLPRPRMGGGN